MEKEFFFKEKLRFGKTVIFKYTFGPLDTNCYLVKNGKEWLMVDPSFLYPEETHYMLDVLDSEKVQLKYIINTHGHFDHIAGNKILKLKYPDSKILIHTLDAGMLSSPIKNRSKELNFIVKSPHSDILLSNNETIKLGNETLIVLHIPGHTKGSIVLKGNGFIFSGDTIFAGTVGTAKEIKNVFSIMIKGIKEKILTLPDDTIILPGHFENSTVIEERKYNPFLQ